MKVRKICSVEKISKVERRRMLVYLSQKERDLAGTSKFPTTCSPNFKCDFGKTTSLNTKGFQI